MRPLEGKVAVVTGAARGLGAATARRLAARGATVALVGLEPAELALAASACDAASGHQASGHPASGAGQARWWEVDVTDSARLAEVAALVEGTLGPVDLLVANAGIAAGGPLLLADAQAFDRVIEVNLLGSVRTIRAFLPQLVRTRGYALQVASLAALTPMPTMAAYCASKAGVESFAQAVAAEVAHHGVGVGVAYLSWIDTDMVRGADAIGALGEQRGRLPFPFGRTYPLEPAAERLARGVERRSRHVYAQPWIRVVSLSRGLVPAVVRRRAEQEAGQTEERFRLDADAQATLPVGPGGRAGATRRTDEQRGPT